MRITANEVHLTLVTDSANPVDKQFDLIVGYAAGTKKQVISLDGLQVADLLQDAFDAEVPRFGLLKTKGLVPKLRP
jgi:hypothetical protein